MAFNLKDIRLCYGERVIFDGLNLGFDSDTISVVLGPSGCGKTTLLNIIAGLKKPDSGQRIGLEEASFSYAFQEPRLMPWLTVKENILFALDGLLKSGSLAPRDAEDRIEGFLSAAGLKIHANTKPAALSGGMRQRVSLVRAFAYPSEILLLDEAFQAVDLATKIELMDSFLELCREEKRTTVLVTHDVTEAAYLADRVVALSTAPARIIDDFCIPDSREKRSWGSASNMETQSRLYRHALGKEDRRMGK